MNMGGMKSEKVQTNGRGGKKQGELRFRYHMKQ